MGWERLKTDRIMEIINSEEHRKKNEEKHPVSQRIKDSVLMEPTYMRWKYHKDWKERNVNYSVYRKNICQVSSLIKIINVYPRSSMNSKINTRK